MKKLQFNLMAILFALFAMVSFTACSDDDDAPSEGTIKENIVGMWQTTHISGWSYDDTEDEKLIKVDTDIDEKNSERIIFRKDGTWECWYRYSESYGWQTPTHSDEYKYEISGNKIFLYACEDLEDTYTVISIKGDVVVLEYSIDEGPQYKTKITCKRVH